MNKKIYIASTLFVYFALATAQKGIVFTRPYGEKCDHFDLTTGVRKNLYLQNNAVMGYDVRWDEANDKLVTFLPKLSLVTIWTASTGTNYRTHSVQTSLYSPSAIALDTSSQLVYFSIYPTSTPSVIKRIGYDGQSETTVVTLTTEYIWSLEYDAGTNKLIGRESGALVIIPLANTTDVHRFSTGGTSVASSSQRSIFRSPVTSHIYYSVRGSNDWTFHRFNPSTETSESCFTFTGIDVNSADVTGIAYDDDTNKLYWSIAARSSSDTFGRIFSQTTNNDCSVTGAVSAAIVHEHTGSDFHGLAVVSGPFTPIPGFSNASALTISSLLLFTLMVIQLLL